jgi:methylmalonyl-CoA/ethylmalonyl-CoA epimerase
MKLPDVTALKSAGFPRINQIGILVGDIPEAAAYYSALLGIGPWFRSNTAKHALSYQGNPISLDVDIVIAFRGGMEYELIQVKGGDECVYSDMLRKSGGGLHHLGAIAPGFDRKLGTARKAGIDVLQSGVITTRGGAVTRYAYLDTTSQCGIITELIETKLMGIYVPHNRAMMVVGLATGDAQRLRV